MHCCGSALRLRKVSDWLSRCCWNINSMSISQQFALSNEAINEIVSYLPKAAGKNVVELDGHSAELTSRLASSVTTVHATSDGLLNPTIGTSSTDLIVSANGAFSQLSNQTVRTSLVSVLDGLKEGGYVFLLETCYADRKPIEYTALIEQALNNGFGFQIERASLLKTAVQQGNFDVVWWLLRKVTNASEKKVNALGKSADQQFLDGVQYSVKGILKYERIFGLDYVSTGGEYTTRQFCETLHTLTSNKESSNPVKVLDIGCGTGGSAFFMKNQYGAHTLGIDLSVNMISIAFEKQREKKCDGVQFLVADATTIDFEENSFDLIYSRDAILHIHNKLELFKSFFKWLKPGGEVFITDYCATDAKPWSTEFSEYVAQRGYQLLSTTSYGALLSQAGFSEVRAINNTQLFVSILRRELELFTPEKESFLRDFKQSDYDSIIDGWNDKIRRCEQMDEQHWGTFYAKKL